VLAEPLPSLPRRTRLCPQSIPGDPAERSAPTGDRLGPAHPIPSSLSPYFLSHLLQELSAVSSSVRCLGAYLTHSNAP
jgi:hypothetical protein